MRIYPFIVIFSALGFVLSSCEKLPVNPDEVQNKYDTSHPKFNYPRILSLQGPQILGSDGSVVTFSWTTNAVVARSEYRFDQDGFQSVGTGGSVQSYNLDEGVHTFTLKSYHFNEFVYVDTSITFTVDAVKGPALMFKPRFRRISAATDFIDSIKVEEVAGALGASFVVKYDPRMIQISEVKSPFEPELLLLYNQRSGELLIDFVCTGSLSHGLNGSTAVVTITCRGLGSAGQTTFLAFDKVIFRDLNNAGIAVRETPNAKVEFR